MKKFILFLLIIAAVTLAAGVLPQWAMNLIDSNSTPEITRDCGCELEGLITEEMHTIRQEEGVKGATKTKFGAATTKRLKSILEGEFAVGLDFSNTRKQVQEYVMQVSNEFPQLNEDIALSFRMESIFYTAICKARCADDNQTIAEINAFKMQALEAMREDFREQLRNSEDVLNAAQREAELTVTIEPSRRVEVVESFATVYDSYVINDTETGFVTDLTPGDIVRVSQRTTFLDSTSVSGQTNHWYYCTTDRGDSGWIFGGKLQQSDLQNTKEWEEMDNRVTQIQQNGLLYLTPDTATEPITGLQRGVTIRISKRTLETYSQRINDRLVDDRWYQINIPDLEEEGWVFGYHLRDQPIVLVDGSLTEQHTDLPTTYDQTTTVQRNTLVTTTDISPEFTARGIADEQKYMIDYNRGENLRFRNITTIPDLRYDRFATGTIRVKVKIDEYGQVVRAKWQRKKSDNDPVLKEIAEGLVNRFEFERGVKQVGVMTFTFKENPAYVGGGY